MQLYELFIFFLQLCYNYLCPCICFVLVVKLFCFCVLDPFQDGGEDISPKQKGIKIEYGNYTQNLKKNIFKNSYLASRLFLTIDWVLYR